MTEKPKYRDRIVGAGGASSKGGAIDRVMGGSQTKEDPNTLQSRSTARFLDLIGEGPIVGLATNDARSVYFNDVPVMAPNGALNFTGVQLDQRIGAGWGHQDHMPGYPSAANVIPIAGGGGQEIVYTNGTADVGGVSVQLTNPDADAVIIRLQTPQMYQASHNNGTPDGNIHGSFCNFEVYVAADGGNLQFAYASAIAGKTMSPYQRDIRIPLPPGGAPWTVKVIRTTPLVGSPETEHNDIFFVSATEVVDTKLSYHNTAYVGVTIDTAQFTGGPPSRSYDIKGLYVRTPSNYNPITRQYAGDWNGVFVYQWTDNPVWCYFDLLVNTRYGLGLPLESVEPWKWELYQIGQYCDQYIPDGNGGNQPRFTCNIILNTQQEAYAVINTMASIFRGMCYWSSGAVRTTADMPKAPVALVTNSNVIGGEFRYEGTALKARHSICKVIWNDPEDNFKAHVEYVENQDAINKYGPRMADIVAYGATNRAQAIRAGKWLLDTENTSTETVTFRGGLDMAGMFPGMIVEVADQDYANGVFGGRVVSTVIDRTSLTIDRDFTFVAGQVYTLDVMLPSGSIATKTLGNAAGTSRALTWGGPLPEQPIDGAVWVIRRTSLQPRQYLIISNVEVGHATFELVGLFHDPAKFDRVEFGIIVPAPPYSTVPTGEIRPPTSLACLLRLYETGSAIAAAAILSWANADDSRVYMYEVQVQGPNDQTFVNVGTETFNSIEYKDVVEGLHTFRVRSISLTGRGSVWSTPFTVNLTSNIPPADVTELETTYDPNGVAFKWKPNKDLNLDHYEVRRGASWDEGTVVAIQANTTYVEKGVATGSFTYWVKAVTTPQGQYGVNAASIVITIAAAPAPTVTASIFETDYVLSWNQVVGSFQTDHYEVRWGGTSFADAIRLGTTKGTTWEAPLVWVGLRKFWVVAVDVFGNFGDVGSCELFVQPPSAVSNLTAQVIDNNVMLRWSASVAGRLPIKHYEIRQGLVYATAEVIGTKQGTFTSVFELAAGQRTYWVAAVDTAGNAGPETAVSARVQQPPDYVLHADVASDFGAINQAGTLTRTATGNRWAGLAINDYEVADQTIKFAVWMKAGTETGTVTLRIRNGTEAEVAEATFTPTSTWTRYSVSKTFSGSAADDIHVYIDPDNNTGTIGATLHIFQPEVSNGLNLDLLITADWDDTFYGLLNGMTWEPNTLHGPFDGVSFQMAPEEGTLFGPLDNTETYEEHFISNGWATPQEQVDAGHPLYIQPVPMTGTYQEIIDFEAKIPTTLIMVTLTKVDFSGDVGATCVIETSPDCETWTTVSTNFQGLSTDFRYARVSLTFTGDGNSLANIIALHYTLSVKLKNDNGKVQVAASDVGGTPVSFNLPYIDVQTINVTALGTTPLTAIYDFDDAPNPSSFKVFLFNSSGARVDGVVSWTARGV